MNYIFILSKDRAAQLDSLLRQIGEYVIGYDKIYIQYTYSSELHERAYNKLIGMHEKPIEWVLETDGFAYHYKYILDEMEDSDYVFLLCDDDVIYREIDINFCSQFLDTHLGFSTRLGENNRWCAVAHMDEYLPESADKLYYNANDYIYSIDWEAPDAVAAFAYPLGINDMVFSVGNYRMLVYKVIDRNPVNPNVLEGYLQDVANQLSGMRMCSYKIQASCCTCMNRVQHIACNRFGELFYLDIDDAATKFMECFNINFDTSNIYGSSIEIPFMWECGV